MVIITIMIVVSSFISTMCIHIVQLRLFFLELQSMISITVSVTNSVGSSFAISTAIRIAIRMTVFCYYYTVTIIPECFYNH